MKKINIVVKIILPLILGLFLIAIVSVYSNFFLLEKNISTKADERFQLMNNSLSSIVQEDTNLMLGLIEQLEKDPKTIQYYKNQDRESLYLYLMETYQSYRQRYDITHFYIHKLNKQNFLRVHNKKKHSDFINRVTLNNAAKNFKKSSGIEFGIYHNLTLRVVIPWIVEDKIIGYIELGKEIDKLTPRIAHLVDVDIVFTVKKELISKENFENWKSNNRNRHYEIMKNHYIIDSTIKKIGKNLLLRFDEKKSYKDHQYDYIDNNSKRYFIHSSPFLDISDKEVGKFYILIDIKEEYDFLVGLIIKVSCIILVLLFLMIIYYYDFLQQKENELNEMYLEVQRVSITDALTNLFNKRYYLNNAKVQMNNCSRCNGYISFILLDCDKFKKYNDFYGHLKGDDVLITISNAMQKVFRRASDCCYRVGGEEFLIVSASNDRNNGYKMAEILRKSINNLSIEHEKNKENIVTVSIGVCTQKADNITKIETLYDNADKALYKSKENGRDQVTLFENIT